MTASPLVAGPAVRPAPCEHGFVTDLVLRCGRGDQDALARLFHLFYPSVARALAVTVPSRDLHTAVTEVFVRLWRTAPTYQTGRQSGVSWVMALLPQPVQAVATTPMPAPGDRSTTW